MNLPSCWLKNLRFHSKKLAIVTCHIYFLQTCLNLGLIPKGLTVKPALSAMPPFMWKSICELAHKQSLALTQSVLNMYTEQRQKHNQAVQDLTSIIVSSHPNLIEAVNSIINKALLKMNAEAEKKLRKLSNLYKQLLKNNISIGLTSNTKTIQPPLIGDRPSLASLIGLPTPYGQLPKLPVHKTQRTKPINTTTKPQTQQICNLSTHELTEAEKTVLSKGLTFCPTPKFDHFTLIKDVMTLARNLRIKHFFDNQPAQFSSKLDSSLSKFKPPSDWDPPPLPADHPIEQYISFLVQNISDPTFADTINNSSNSNLTPQERRAINTLKNNELIQILPADKGSTTVVMDKTDYVKEIERQLSDSSTYQLLTDNPTNKFTSELRNLVEGQARSNGLSPETTALLVPQNPITPKIYILPKIHKGVTPPPGRPIVSGCGSPTERISAFVDSHLQPLVKDLPSHIRDSSDFLQKLHEIAQPLPEGTILATVDVTSLYTNIPHTLGLAALDEFLQLRPKGSTPTTSFLLSLARFILEKNNFQFQDKHYLQIKGTAMGTRMAPSYANLYMGRLERNFLKSQSCKPICWLRFIDDIFLIWTHGEESLSKFLQQLNTFSPLQFTWNTSTSTINFLDLNVNLQNGLISTTIFTKPTNHHQYLHFSSCHPNNTKRSLPYSLALRGNRLISNPEEKIKYTNQIQEAFKNRGYPEKLVRQQISAAQSTPNHPKPKNDTNLHVNLITTFHPGLQKLNNLLKTGYKILSNSSQTKTLLEKPPTIVYRQPPNLRNLLVRPKLPDPSTVTNEKPPPGSFPCQEKKCKTCQINPPSETFTSSSTGKEYKIIGHHTCNSENLIYQIECNLCQAQYVGLTTETLRKRMNGHRHDVKTHRLKPVAQHAEQHNMDFNECFTTKALRSFPKETCNSSELRRWELAYQYITDSRNPPNLNLR